jgi:hypothetical protein
MVALGTIELSPADVDRRIDELEVMLAVDQAVSPQSAELSESYVDEQIASLEASLAVTPEFIGTKETIEAAQLVYEVPQLETEQLARTRAAKLIGWAAVRSSAEVASTPEAPTASLLDALERARGGDPVARRLVETNVRTDMIERSIKAGHVMEVELDVDASGRVSQYGQTNEAIQANSLRFAGKSLQMRERTEAETRNMYRIEQLLRLGMLDDYVFVVFSRAADNMTQEAAHKAGFFTDTMSMAIQATTVSKKDKAAALYGTKLTTESAFVAGKKTRLAPRHDATALLAVGDKMSIDTTGTATQQLDKPKLIHKSLIPNGVIDLVRFYDAGNGTFFGQKKPPQDYLSFREQCRKREVEMEPMVQLVVNQLIAESHDMLKPTDATRRLNDLSEEQLVRRAVTDEAIDVRVFGKAAANRLYAARQAYADGDYRLAFNLTDDAVFLADSGSCPTDIEDGIPFVPSTMPGGFDQYGSLTFTCPRGHTNHRPRGALIPNCLHCGVSVRC